MVIQCNNFTSKVFEFDNLKVFTFQIHLNVFDPMSGDIAAIILYSKYRYVKYNILVRAHL